MTPLNEITIYRVLNGFAVKAGCQVLVFEGSERAAREISEWLMDPVKREKPWRELYDQQCKAQNTPEPRGDACCQPEQANIRPAPTCPPMQPGDTPAAESSGGLARHLRNR